MDRCLNPIQQVNLLGSYDDESICLASAALGLSLMGNQPMSFYTDHLAELSDAVAAYYASIAKMLIYVLLLNVEKACLFL
jgi:hypothetical protein